MEQTVIAIESGHVLVILLAILGHAVWVHMQTADIRANISRIDEAISWIKKDLTQLREWSNKVMLNDRKR